MSVKASRGVRIFGKIPPLKPSSGRTSRVSSRSVASINGNSRGISLLDYEIKPIGKEVDMAFCQPNRFRKAEMVELRNSSTDAELEPRGACSWVFLSLVSLSR